jgi:hypothetical protein
MGRLWRWYRHPWRTYRGWPRWAQITTAFVLVLVIVGIATASPAKTPGGSTASTTTQAPKTTAAVAPSIPKAETEARAYIVAHGGDGYRVRAIMANLIAEYGAFKAAPSQTTLDQLATVAQQAHDDLDAIRANFATATDPGTLGNAELDAFSGANDLKNAMGALVTETGAPNAANVAHFNVQYAQAVAEWNRGVRTIWRIAHRASPPLV